MLHLCVNKNHSLSLSLSASAITSQPITDAEQFLMGSGETFTESVATFSASYSRFPSSGLTEHDHLFSLQFNRTECKTKSTRGRGRRGRECGNRGKKATVASSRGQNTTIRTELQISSVMPSNFPDRGTWIGLSLRLGPSVNDCRARACLR